MKNLIIIWTEIAPGFWQTRTVDPRNGKTYLGHPVPTALALKLGMAVQKEGASCAFSN